MKLISIINALVFTIIALFATSVVASAQTSSEVHETSCTPTSRVKQFPEVNHNVLRGDGIIGSYLKNIKVTVVEDRTDGCLVRSKAVVDFLVKNKWHGGNATVHIDFLSNGRVIAKDGIAFARPGARCGPFGNNPGWPIYFERALPENLIDSITDINIYSDRISGKIGEC